MYARAYYYNIYIPPAVPTYMYTRPVTSVYTRRPAARRVATKNHQTDLTKGRPEG